MALNSFISKFRVIRYVYPCYLSSKPPVQKIVKEIDPNTGELKSKKTNIIPRITLLNGDQISVSTLGDAEKLAKRRDRKLVKVVDLDTKTQRPVYRLMTGAEYHAEDLQQRARKKIEKSKQTIKGEKLLLVNARISTHDLDTHLNKAEKWLKKHYEVKVVIGGADAKPQEAEKIYGLIEGRFGSSPESKIVQKRTKGPELRFQILPIIIETSDL